MSCAITSTNQKIFLESPLLYSIYELGLRIMAIYLPDRSNMLDNVRAQLAEELQFVGRPKATALAIDLEQNGEEKQSNGGAERKEDDLDEDDDGSLFDDLLVLSQSQDPLLLVSAEEDYDNFVGEVLTNYFS
jgi:hypothetical protein